MAEHVVVVVVVFLLVAVEVAICSHGVGGVDVGRAGQRPEDSDAW